MIRFKVSTEAIDQSRERKGMNMLPIFVYDELLNIISSGLNHIDLLCIDEFSFNKMLASNGSIVQTVNFEIPLLRSLLLVFNTFDVDLYLYKNDN